MNTDSRARNDRNDKELRMKGGADPGIQIIHREDVFSPRSCFSVQLCETEEVPDTPQVTVYDMNVLAFA